MSLSKQYRQAKDMLRGETITLPIWDVLVLLDMIERTPMLDAEDRYIESMNNIVGARVATMINTKIAAITDESKVQEPDKIEDDTHKIASIPTDKKKEVAPTTTEKSANGAQKI